MFPINKYPIVYSHCFVFFALFMGVNLNLKLKRPSPCTVLENPH